MIALLCCARYVNYCVESRSGAAGRLGTALLGRSAPDRLETWMRTRHFAVQVLLPVLCVALVVFRLVLGMNRA